MDNEPKELHWSQQEIDLADPKTDVVHLISILMDDLDSMMQYIDYQEEREHFASSLTFPKGDYDYDEFVEQKMIENIESDDSTHIVCRMWQAQNNIDRIKKALGMPP